MHRIASLLCISAVLTVLLLNTGCPQMDHYIGHLGAATNSYDIEGERVELVMLDETGLNEELDHAGIDRNSVATKNKEFAVAAALIPFIVDKAYDFVVDQLKKEADRYEQQYSATASASSFWLTEGQSRWKGFVLRRYTRASGETPAASFLFLILPIEHGKFLSVRPLCVNISHVKAKIVGKKVTAKITITQRSMWVDGDGVLQNKDLQTFDWTVSGYQFLSESPRYFNCKTYIGSPATRPSNAMRSTTSPPTTSPSRLEDHPFLEAGVLVGPPRSAVVDEDADPVPDSTGTPKKPVKEGPNGGMMRLTLAVTERDETNAQQYIQKVEKFAEEKKPTVMKYVQSKFSTTQPATQQ